MKRIISQVDYWFSEDNLRTDDFLREELKKYGGHVRISTLASFPKLRAWTDARLVVDALTNAVCRKRYRVIYNRELAERAATNGRHERNQRMCKGNAKEGERRSKRFERLGELTKKLRSNISLFNQETSADMEKATHPADVNDQEAREETRKKSDDDEITMDDGEFPTIVHDDGSDNLSHALVRHKKVSLDYLSYLTESLEEAERRNKKEEVGPAQAQSSRTKRKRLKRYSSAREICVITNSAQLTSFCQKLTESVASYSTSAGVSKAIGFDAEYCTLEECLSSTLPAMLQLASPHPDGPTGLIWLDKFSNHGRDVIRDAAECQDLLAVLGDGGISKVGAGASKDARHLAKWWGIEDAQFASIYFSGMVDLEAEPEFDELHRKSLRDMCIDALNRDLPKIKERGHKRKKEMRKKGRRIRTSHWRCDRLTNDMKRYAADDSSCAIDIWLKMRKGPDFDEAIDQAAIPYEPA